MDETKSVFLIYNGPQKEETHVQWVSNFEMERFWAKCVCGYNTTIETRMLTTKTSTQNTQWFTKKKW
jgi:hypothetical protein